MLVDTTAQFKCSNVALIEFEDCYSWAGLQLGLLDGCNLRVCIADHWDDFIAEGDSHGIKQEAARRGLPGELEVHFGLEKMIDALEWCDYVYINQMDKVPLKIYRELAKIDKPIIYGSKFISSLEFDRKLAQEFHALHGMECSADLAVEVNLKLYDTVDKIREFVFASFPGSKTPPVLKSDRYTGVPNSWLDFDAQASIILGHFKNDDTLRLIAEPNLNPDLICEFAFASYFNGEEFYPSVIFTVEYKEIFDHPMVKLNCGESATNMTILDRKDAEDHWAILNRYAPALKASNYKGFFDLNCLLVKTDGGEPRLILLEHTARPGYPTEIEVYHLMHKNGYNVGAFMAWVAGLDKRSFSEGYDQLERQERLLPGSVFCNAVAIQSIVTNLPNTEKLGLPVAEIIDGNPKSENIDIVPAMCLYNEQGNIYDPNFDRAAFAMYTLKDISFGDRRTWKSFKDDIRVGASDSEWSNFSILDSQEALNKYLLNVSAPGHHYNRESIRKFHLDAFKSPPVKTLYYPRIEISAEYDVKRNTKPDMDVQMLETVGYGMTVFEDPALAVFYFRHGDLLVGLCRVRSRKIKLKENAVTHRTSKSGTKYKVRTRKNKERTVLMVEDMVIAPFYRKAFCLNVTTGLDETIYGMMIEQVLLYARGRDLYFEVMHQGIAKRLSDYGATVVSTYKVENHIGYKLSDFPDGKPMVTLMRLFTDAEDEEEETKEEEMFDEA